MPYANALPLGAIDVLWNLAPVSSQHCWAVGTLTVFVNGVWSQSGAPNGFIVVR